MSEYKKVINQVVAKSGLSGLEKERLEEELQAHFEDANKDYLTKGKSEEEVIEDFGDPKLVGQQIRIVKKKWERIPILGDLIYYPVFRQALGLGFMELFAMFFVPITSFLVWSTLGDRAAEYLWGNWLTLIIIGLLGLLLFSFIIIRGALAYRTIKKIGDLFLLMFLALVPMLVVLSLYCIPQLVIYGNDNLNYSLLMLYVFIFILVFNSVYLMSYLFTRLIKKYVR